MITIRINTITEILQKKFFYPAHSSSLVQFRRLIVFATEVFDLGF